jgi:hypothetical protein
MEVHKMTITKPPVRSAWASTATPHNVVDPGEAFCSTGWQPSAVPPARQFLNWILNYCSNGIRYFSRRGVADYDMAETYLMGDIARGDDGFLYQSIANDNISNTPSTSSKFWTALQMKIARTPAEIAAGVMPANYSYPPNHVLRYGTITNPGVTDMTTAIQACIDVAAHGPGQVIFDPGNYLITSCLNCTSDNRLNRSAIQYVGGSRRGAVTITCSTGSWAADLSGSAWTSWAGIYFVQGKSNPSFGGFIACATTFQESLYHTFREIYVQLYNTSAPSTYGTIGWALMGSEENTFIGTQTFCNTPFFLSTSYSFFSANYPSPYQNAKILDGHSQGVTTFAGENLAVTWDQKGANIVMHGANSTDFGNMYFGNINVGAVGSGYKCISVIGGTLEGCRGRFKIEARQTLLSVDKANAELIGWDINCTLGAGITNAHGIFEINPGARNVFSGKLNSIKIGVWYDMPSNPSGKPLILYSGVMDGGTTTQSISNIEIECNQTLAQFSGFTPPVPSLFCGTVNSFDLKFADVNFWINAHRQIKRVKTSLFLGPGDGSAPKPVATVVLPPVVGSQSARAIQVRAKGLVSSVNEAGGGTDSDITMCPFETVVSAYSLKQGTIVASTGASDKVFTPTSTLMSNNPALFQFTGMNLTQTVSGRVITLVGAATGTGTSLSALSAYVNDLEIEMITSGRIGDLIYLI